MRRPKEKGHVSKPQSMEERKVCLRTISENSLKNPERKGNPLGGDLHIILRIEDDGKGFDVEGRLFKGETRMVRM
jgi:hypothetical protein